MPETREIHGPATWMGPDLQDTTDWVHELDEGHREELLTALAAVEVAGLDFLEIGKDEFQLPTLGPMIEGLIDDEVLAGRGFVLLRGVPLDGLTERQIELMYWGLGNYFGMPLAQGEHATDLFAHVRDEGVDRNLNTGGGLLNKHSEALPFHTDSSDVVGLLCINPAMKGGASTIVSAAAVHNEILRTRPDLLEVMYEQFWFDRKRGDGPESFAECPIFAINDKGVLYSFWAPDPIRTAVRGENVPDLTDRQQEALDLINEITARREFQLHMNFQRGEIQLINNYIVWHSRADYEDWPDPALKRDLIRFWVTIDRDLEIPDEMEHRGLRDRSEAFA